MVNLAMAVPSTAECVDSFHLVIRQLVNVMHVQLDIKDSPALKVSVFSCSAVLMLH